MPAMSDRFQRKADVIYIPGKENPAKGHMLKQMLLSRIFNIGRRLRFYSLYGVISWQESRQASCDSQRI